MEHIKEQFSKLTDIVEKIVNINEKMVIKINALEEENKRLWYEVNELKKQIKRGDDNV